MELSKYLGKYVRIDLDNGYFYEGRVTNTDEKYLELIDKNNKYVTLRIEIIVFIREVGE